MEQVATSPPASVLSLPGVGPVSAAAGSSPEPAKKACPVSLPGGEIAGQHADSDRVAEPAGGIKSVAKPSRDERRHPRSAVPEERQSSQLKVAGRTMPARLVEKSAGGFAVLVDCADGLSPRKKGDLYTDAGHFKVRIVYVNNAARPADAAAESGPWSRVGLKKARSFRIF
jgi:hypothetical protein